MIKSVLRKILDNSIVKLVNYISVRIIDNSPTHRADLHATLCERAIEDSADYVQEHLSGVMIYKDILEQLWNYTIQQLSDKEKGICLEFGVFSGSSINYLSKRLPQLSFIGFDSFEGLAEDWIGHRAKKGSYNLNGNLPIVNSNVSLVKGWFDETLPKFFSEQPSDFNLVFVHIDSDTYQAATTVLNELKSHIKPGLLIIFDEYIGYPNWRNGEFLAWKEFCKTNNIKYRYRGFSTYQALIEVI